MFEIPCCVCAPARKTVGMPLISTQESNVSFGIFLEKSRKYFLRKGHKNRSFSLQWSTDLVEISYLHFFSLNRQVFFNKSKGCGTTIWSFKIFPNFPLKRNFQLDRCITVIIIRGYLNVECARVQVEETSDKHVDLCEYEENQQSFLHPGHPVHTGESQEKE